MPCLRSVGRWTPLTAKSIGMQGYQSKRLAVSASSRPSPARNRWATPVRPRSVNGGVLGNLWRRGILKGEKRLRMTDSRNMQIEGIEIRNYRQFRHVELTNLSTMTVVVGANGSGKSTFFDVFKFLKDALDENVTAGVARRGGFNELVSREQDGPIEITVKFSESGGRLVTYLLRIGLEAGRALVLREVLSYGRGQRGETWRVVDFRKGVGKAITNESAYGEEGAIGEHQDYALADASTLAIKGLGQFQEFRVVSEVRGLIENWHISNLHVGEIRASIDDGYAEHLSATGDNAALVAHYLYQRHPDIFQQVLQAMSRRVPGIQAVEATPTGDGRLILRFQDGTFERPFIGRHVSDGTIKMFAYLLLLHDAKPHPLLAVEGPEDHLPSHLLGELARDFRNYAERGGQVFVSSLSPEFLNQFDLGQVFCFVKEGGFSKVVRPADDEHLRELANGGDPTGRLWRRGLFEDVSK